MLLLLIACADPEPDCPAWFSDLDGDGYGSGSGVSSCDALAGRVQQDGDCDDRDGLVNPEAADVPLDGVDQDCDGQDTCASTQLVRSMDEVDCSLGWYVLDGDASAWPEGDCVCEVSGDVDLSASTADRLGGTLMRVGGNLTIRSGDGWAARGLDALSEVGGGVAIDLAGDADFPALRSATVVSLSSQRAGQVRLDALEELDVLHLEGGVDLQAQSLAQVGTITMSGRKGNTLKLPGLLTADTVTAGSGVFSAPELQSLGRGSFERTEAELPSLNQLTTLEIGVETSLELPQLRAVGHVMLYGSLNAPLLDEADTLQLLPGSSAALPRLEQVSSLSTDSSDFEMPNLSSAGLIEIGPALQVTLPLLLEVEEIALSGSTLNVPLLQSAALISLSNTSGTALFAPRLSWAGYIESGAPIELPSLLQVDELNLKSSASCPALLQAQVIRSTGPLFAPSLLAVGSLRLDDSGNDLSGLRSVDALRTQDCEAFGALTKVGQVETTCTLDLRGLSSSPGPLTYLARSTESGLLLPDPLPDSLWVNGQVWGTLDQDRIEGALSIQSWAKWGPEDFVVREVGGQLFLQLNDMTSLGTLSQVEVIEGDLSYCMPQVPDAEIQAWLSTVSVGGRVNNRCP